MATAEHFDAVVVGSGFGGSVTAYRLAEKKLSVCLLERGKPYGPGDFARTPHAMSRNLWDPSEGLQGLFDIWSFRHIEAVVSAGLGGGSLIYANVFLRKDEHWFDDDGSAWPVSREELEPHYDAVQEIIELERYPFGRAPYDRTPKTVAFKEAAEQAGLDWTLPPLAVAFGDGPPGEPIVEEVPNLHDRQRSTCRLVGECDLGCNYGAKNSLDHNYLTLASRRHGAEIRTRCEVRSIAPLAGGGYSIRYVEHADEDEGRRTNTSTLAQHEITAERLVLSAGTLGTTYLLLRNRDTLGGLPEALGTRFCGNGDLLSFATNARRREGEREGMRVLEPSYGPVISSTVRVDDSADGGTGPGYYIQEGGYPAFASWMVESTDLPGGISRAARFLLGRFWDAVWAKPDSNISAELSRLIGATARSSALLPMLGMGRDTPDGRMTLDDGKLAVDWSVETSEAYFDRVRDSMRALSEAMGADWAESPTWRFKRVITVHPLGGCPMSDGGPRTGVVDSRGGVYGHPGLYVADGSMMPGPVGANPSFTIAALADRVSDRILEDHASARP